MDEERRATKNPMDVAGGLALLYTGVFAITVILLFFVEIPAKNKEPLLQIFGLMSAVMMAIVTYYFGSSKSGEATQRAVEQRQGRSEAVVQEIAKAIPVAAVVAAAAPAPSKDVQINTENTTITTETPPKETLP